MTKNDTHLLVPRLVLLGHLLVLGLNLRLHVGPLSAELLGDVPHAVLRIQRLDLVPFVVAEPEERRPIG